MSRSLLGFLLFCLLLALVSGGVVWYVGPTLAGIVFDGERRANAYYLLQLLPEAAAHPRGDDPSYRARFLALAREDEGSLVWQGGSCEVREGPVLLDVASTQILKFATGGDLVQMLTSSGHRALDAGFSGLALRVLGTPVAPAELPADQATVLVLYHGDGSGPMAPLGAPGESGWLQLLPGYGGTIRWRAPVDSIRGGEDWNRLLLIQFPRVTAAEDWLRDPVTVTERAIAGMRVDAMVILLIHPSTFALR